MKINLLFLFGFLFNQVYGLFFNVTDTQANIPLFEARYADITENHETLVQLFLYQGNSDAGTIIPHVHNEDIIGRIDRMKKTFVLFNGHPSGDSDIPFAALRKAIFSVQDVNIIYAFIDWSKHQITFLDALLLANSLGQFIGTTLKTINLNINNCHFIAHCAGAEVGVSVANVMKMYTGVSVPRMTAFDPYLSDITSLPSAKNSIDFIDVYHAGIYTPLLPPIGTIDFYPNGGIRQPGCEEVGDLEKALCSHQRSIYLYAESINRNDVKATEAYFSMNQSHLRPKNNPQHATFGYHVDTNQHGAYYLPTLATPPYLKKYF